MNNSLELRSSVYSFQQTLDNKEVHEARQDQDQNRYDSAIGDLAKRKINDIPYGLSIKKPLFTSTAQVGLPHVKVEVSDVMKYNDVVVVVIVVVEIEYICIKWSTRSYLS